MADLFEKTTRGGSTYFATPADNTDAIQIQNFDTRAAIVKALKDAECNEEEEEEEAEETMLKASPVTSSTESPLEKENGQLDDGHRLASRRKVYMKARRSKRYQNSGGLQNKQAKAKAKVMNSSALPVGFDAAGLAICKSGWLGKNVKKSSVQQQPPSLEAFRNEHTDFRLVEWDGKSLVRLVDSSQRIVGVLGGMPSGDYEEDMKALVPKYLSIADEYEQFTSASMEHRRGVYSVAHDVKLSYLGGQQQPQPMRTGGDTREEICKKLSDLKGTVRIRGYQSSIMRSCAPRMFEHYEATRKAYAQWDPRLEWPQSESPFAATTFNLGPSTVTRLHRDYSNFAPGWCAITALGTYDPDKGGHLVLWEFKLIIRFPPGATIMIPSAILTHSNVAIRDGEKRLSVVSYTAGGLFLYSASGFQTQASLAKTNPAKKTELGNTSDERINEFLNLYMTLDELNV